MFKGKLHDCGWCGSQSAIPVESEGGNGMRVLCDCGLSSPDAQSKDKAIENWNRLNALILGGEALQSQVRV
jgi:hypothetical protein